MFVSRQSPKYKVKVARLVSSKLKPIILRYILKNRGGSLNDHVDISR